MTQQPFRLAVVGGHRGANFDDSIAALQGRVDLTAVCDLSEQVLEAWRKKHPSIRTFTSYEAMLEKADCDAVFICTPLGLHAQQAVQALEAGKHVLSEVVAAATLDDCWRLVETVEKTGRTYMLAENYCYMRSNMMVSNMARQGVFGEMNYAEGAYIHDCCALLFTEDNQLTWRGHYRRAQNANTYPTHSLGPVAQWLGINRPDGDRLVSTATWISPSRAAAAYARERLGPEHPAAQNAYWKVGDSAITLIQTAKGALIVLRVDWASPRPHNMTHYVLQGSQASYLSARCEGEDPLIWIDGISPGGSPENDAEWEPLWKYCDSYEHPYWRELGVQAIRSGHGGGDFFVLRDFAEAVATGGKPPIDVYDAVTWSCLVPLSAQSIAQGSAPLPVPDFRRK